MLRKRFVWIFLVTLFLSGLPVVTASSITSASDATFFNYFPLIFAFLAAVIIRIWFIPSQLSNLQVAFEVDDDVYEVHRITHNSSEVRELFKVDLVNYGIILYLMGLTGVLILIAELLFDANQFFEINLMLIALLIAIPVIISPWETLNVQILGRRQSGSLKPSFTSTLLRRVLTIGVLIGATGAVLFYGQSIEGKITPLWVGISLLAFMSPTIFAYGRIMGASWNMLLISKWRTTRGKANPIDPDKNGFLGRLFSFILVIFLLTMPLTALNGIVTVLHVLVNKPVNQEEVLNYGGIIGHALYTNIDEISEVLGQLEFIKSLPEFLSLYLTMNIAIVGLAFIFELTRNLVLGGQTFGGLFGVTLDTPREIRSEKSAQARQLTFAFAGFSGYTVLLLILVCYKEFGELMPLIDVLEKQGFDEGMRLLTTWMFIAVGQVIFLLAWVLSIAKFASLSNLSFDLDPETRREGAVKLAGGDWLRDLIEDAAGQEDIDMLVRIQEHEFSGDPSLIRQEKIRASMWEKALRGLWPQAIEEGRKVLAQAGGDDDPARMVIATGYLALRRLDAAKEALNGLEQDEGYDEPELLSFVAEWLDPWQGNVSEDDLWDWENNPIIEHLQDTLEMLSEWSPVPDEMRLSKNKITLVSQLSMVGLLRAQRRYDEALDLAYSLVRQHPTGVRPRIAVALCLVDIGEWHDARDILDELIESDPNDPRVLALSAIFGYGQKGRKELEVSIVLDKGKQLKRWIDLAPTNAFAGIQLKGGMDEALTANVLIASHEAVRQGMPSRYSRGILSYLFVYVILFPVMIGASIFYSGLTTETEGAVAFLIGLSSYLFYRRFKSQQEHLIQHRDQALMIKYAKRMKRFKVKPQEENIPIGTHLLLSGILVTVNGVVLDIGFPAWMIHRCSTDSDKVVRSRLKKRAMKMVNARDPRFKILGKAWWLKRPRENEEDTTVLQRNLGNVAYRGRPQYIQRKLPASLNSLAKSGKVDVKERFIPRNTIRSERNVQRLTD